MNVTAVAAPYELPPEQKAALREAKRLEWLSIGFLGSIVILMGIVMGNSQAMKAMWLEDLLSIVPSMSFLVAARFREKAPNERYPYGYRRALLVGFMSGAVALFGFGVYMLLDSVWKLIEVEHPSVPSMQLFGHLVWLGWLMVLVLVYSVIPPLILGRKKTPVAERLHDKGLHVSAALNRGDWLSGLAGAVGIIGIAFGLWWADSAAAALISIEIVKDGYQNLRNSTAQLMNKRPTDISSKQKDPVIDRLKEALERLDWVVRAQVRLREDGDILTGEAFVVPGDTSDIFDKLEQAGKVPASLDWRLHGVTIVPVRSLE
jgi:cation diffusion facilitator family transporter